MVSRSAGGHVQAGKKENEKIIERKEIQKKSIQNRGVGTKIILVPLRTPKARERYYKIGNVKKIKEVDTDPKVNFFHP